MLQTIGEEELHVQRRGVGRGAACESLNACCVVSGDGGATEWVLMWPLPPGRTMECDDVVPADSALGSFSRRESLV